MIRRMCYWLSKRLPVFRIQVAGRPYLDRHYIAGPEPSSGFPPGMRLRLRWLPFTIYLHRFHDGDRDRDLHNHPWHAASLILYGGYREEWRTRDHRVLARTIRPGRLHRFGPDHFHRVELLRVDEAWTLFAVGPKRGRRWGFWNRESGAFRLFQDGGV